MDSPPSWQTEQQRHDADLNADQRVVVDHRGRPLLVFAAAGTGKTQALTARIADLVRRDDVPPERVLALTFTRKAAAEMRKRAAARCGCPEHRLRNIGTFHSVCMHLLRLLADDELGGCPVSGRFSVLAPPEALKLLNEEVLPQARAVCGVRSNDSTTTADNVMRAIDVWRNQGLEPEQAAREMSRQSSSDTSDVQRVAAAAYRPYRDACARQDVVDFSDMILHVVAMLERSTRLRAYCQARLFAHLLVDEFQDTNPAQMRLVELLCGHNSAIDGHVAETASTIDDDRKEVEEVEKEEEEGTTTTAGDGGEAVIVKEEEAVTGVDDDDEEDEDFGSLLSGDDEAMMMCGDGDDDDDDDGAEMEIDGKYIVARGGRLGEDRLMVVGDDYQAIHEWRGATVSNIMEFTSTFPQAQVVHLELNYRSRPFILEAAGKLIARNVEQHHKRLTATRGGGGGAQADAGVDVESDGVDDVCNHADALHEEEEKRKRRNKGRRDVASTIRVQACEDAWEEADFIADVIRRTIASSSSGIDTGTSIAIKKAGDFAVLYRVNAQSQPIEQALKAAGVSYVIKGASSFFARAEVKDCMAYARFLVNPKSDADFTRVIKSPARGIGKAVLERLSGSGNGRSMWEAALEQVAPFFAADDDDSKKKTGNTGRAVKAVQLPKWRGARQLAEFVRQMQACQASARATRSSEEALRACLERSTYLQDLRDRASGNQQQQEKVGDSRTKRADAEARLSNVNAFLNLAARFDDQQREDQQKRGGDDSASLRLFVDRCALDMTDDDARERADSDKNNNDGGGVTKDDSVTLMTLHASKGLEFPVVFMAGVCEDVLPYYRSVRENHVPEERRLCYVGVTRARDDLIITYPLKRTLFGRIISSERSRFIDELVE
jgi:superfamily I DNA/RNA helicase